jgi:hypothetical protein
MEVQTSTDFKDGYLTPGEQFWTRRYDWLRSQGYLLRDRYNPKWVPSWQGKNDTRWWQAEDSQLLIVRCRPLFALDSLTLISGHSNCGCYSPVRWSSCCS